MSEITLKGISKTFPDGTTAVSELDLTVPDGSLAVLVGPSGCGKTTLLRMVAGLERPTAGEIRIGAELVNDVPPKNRDVAMVFQNYALYPHMTVFDNMAYALRRRHEKKDTIRTRVESTADMLGLNEHLRKKPAELSGGQRQRVAMGRAIVRQPRAFLMDEPLSNLDAKLRVEMRAEIMRIQRELAVTTIFVTHDQTEALTMGDLVVVMRGGVIQQRGTPDDVFGRPANLFVAGFIGSPPMNLLKARISDGAEGLSVTAGPLSLPIDQDLLASHPGLAQYRDRPIALGIRPEDIEDARFVPHGERRPRMTAQVELRETMGREAILHFAIDAAPALTDHARELVADTDVIALEKLERAAREQRSQLAARVNARTPAQVGDSIELAFDTSLIDFFDLESGNAIV